MGTPNRLIHDKRQIQTICFNDTKGRETIEVGVDGVTEIVAYLDDGEVARDTWLAVYRERKDGESVLTERIPARTVTIAY